jgi:hypothetical protein
MSFIEITRKNKFTPSTSKICLNIDDISEVKQTKNGCSILMVSSGEIHKCSELYDEVISKIQTNQNP